jgi:hypothetical protein
MALWAWSVKFPVFEQGIIPSIVSVFGQVFVRVWTIAWTSPMRTFVASGIFMLGLLPVDHNAGPFDVPKYRKTSFESMLA